LPAEHLSPTSDNAEKKGDCLHNDFDLSYFVEASTNELPREPSRFMAILEKACDNRTNVINASKKKKIK